jgi:hypothetical protein
MTQSSQFHVTSIVQPWPLPIHGSLVIFFFIAVVAPTLIVFFFIVSPCLCLGTASGIAHCTDTSSTYYHLRWRLRYHVVRTRHCHPP